MKASSDFGAIAPNETKDYSFDFSTELLSGDSIASVSAFNCTVAEKSLVQDPSPSSRLTGPYSTSGTLVTQTVTGCVAGVTYVLEAVIVTAAGETIEMWTYLPCVAVGVG